MTKEGSCLSSMLSEEELVVVNNRLKEIVRESGWSRTMDIGDLLVERVFQGEKGALGEPADAFKHPSIRRLAQRPDCPLRKTALAQTIGVYSLVQKEPDLRALTGITPAHVAVVVSFPSEKRREILMRAEAEQWSVRTLSRAVSEIATSDVKSKVSSRANSRRALALYLTSLKSAEAARRLLWQHEKMDQEIAGEILATIHSLAVVLNDSRELVTRMQPSLRDWVAAEVPAKPSVPRAAARMSLEVNGRATAHGT